MSGGASGLKSEGKKFVVDSMLGNLAKWLRIMGYDTLYSRVYSDWQILRVARSSGRIIVTRDRGLYWRARKLGLRAVLIESLNTVERLAELSSKAGVRLELNPSRSRCPLCNGNLVEVKDKALVKDRVPEGSYNSVDRFFVCDRCGKVYWEGSHWRNMKKTLEEAAKLKRSGGFML